MFNRTRPGLLFTLFCLTLSVFQFSYAELEGMWRSEHPELGGVYFRIRSDGSCSYFLEKGTTTTIYKGNWVEIPTGLQLKFSNGVVFSTGEIEPGVADLRMDLSAGHEVNAGIVVSKAELVDTRAIGRMTINASDDEGEDERIGYFGAWEGELISGKKIYMMINEDRTAGITHSFTKPDLIEEYSHVVGYWKKDGENLQVVWNDGSFTTIETNGRRIEQTSFVAGSIFEEAKGFTSRILPILIKDLPQEWYDTFKSDYVTRMPLVVLRNLAQLKSFFRGEWVIGDPAPGSEPKVIKLKRFGNAWTNRYGGVKGDWFPRSDSVSIFWRNGVKESLTSVGNQFMVNSFNPDQPVSGRPARIETANAIDPDKMGYYLNRKKELMDPSRFYKAIIDAKK